MEKMHTMVKNDYLEVNYAGVFKGQNCENSN